MRDEPKARGEGLRYERTGMLVVSLRRGGTGEGRCKSRTVVSLRVFRTNWVPNVLLVKVSSVYLGLPAKKVINIRHHHSVLVPSGDLSRIERKSVLVSSSFTGQMMLEPKKKRIIMMIMREPRPDWSPFGV